MGSEKIAQVVRMLVLVIVEIIVTERKHLDFFWCKNNPDES